MGTTYNVTIISSVLQSKKDLKLLISNRLKEISNTFSTYDDRSEISQFNSITGVENKFYPSRDFLNLLLISRKLYDLVGNVWDPTIGSIVNAWGFGKDGPKNHILGSDSIDKLLSTVNFKKEILFCKDGSIKKRSKDVYLDLASIAKGFGVDQISLLLYEEGFENFLVEIGGEIYANGYRKDGLFWQVGINYPTKILSRNGIYQVVSLSGMAIATSGDYRNYIKINGKDYPHIIDPRTGYPISNFVTSASVIASNCTVADALATAFMLMSPNNTLDLVNNLPSVECIITVLKESGELKNYTSKGIENFQH